MNEVQKRILIAEDDDHISKVYELELAKNGFFVILARNGEEAIQMIKNEKPDLVILDLLLPRKDGFWVLEEVRKNSEYSKIPILILSNLSQEDEQIRALNLGATEYLIKIDYPIQEVVDKINFYLKK